MGQNLFGDLLAGKSGAKLVWETARALLKRCSTGKVVRNLFGKCSVDFLIPLMLNIRGRSVTMNPVQSPLFASSCWAATMSVFNFV